MFGLPWPMPSRSPPKERPGFGSGREDDRAGQHRRRALRDGTTLEIGGQTTLTALDEPRPASGSASRRAPSAPTSYRSPRTGR
jgi:hypothetical protein